MTQAIAPQKVDRFSPLVRQAVFAYLDFDVRLVYVCRVWRDTMHGALLSSWRHLPPMLADAKEIVLKKSAGGDYFKLFQLLNIHLAVELRQLNDEAPKPFRRAFCGRLTSRRFVEMQKAIVAEEQGRAFWERLRRQDSAVADMPSRSLMHKQLTGLRSAPTYEKVIKLDLSRLKWDVIPSELFLLTKLQHLDLSQNQLTELPVEILKLENLTSINLAGNPLAAASSTGKASLQMLSRLPKLKEIILSDRAVDNATAITLSPVSTWRGAVPPETTRLDASPSRTRHPLQTFIAFADGSTYMGEVQDQKPHGEGLLTYPRGNQLERRTYKGQFALGLPHGAGVIKFTLGRKFAGRLENGHMIEGRLTVHDGSYAEGTFKDQQLWDGTYHTRGYVYTYKNGQEQWTNECCTIL